MPESDFNAPMSRNEAILQNILGANNELGNPLSREEALLMMLPDHERSLINQHNLDPNAHPLLKTIVFIPLSASTDQFNNTILSTEETYNDILELYENNKNISFILIESANPIKERYFIVSEINKTNHTIRIISFDNFILYETELESTNSGMSGIYRIEDTSRVQAFILDWIDDPTDPESADAVAANVATMVQIAAATMGQYNLYIRKSNNSYFPADYISSGTVAGIDISTGDPYMRQIEGLTIAGYEQTTTLLLNSGNFDATDYNAAATQQSTAAYIGTRITADRPKMGTLTLSTSWTDNSDGTYSQSVTISGSTANSKVDLQPSAAAVSQMVDDGVAALYINNNNGTLTAVAVGEAPTAQMSVQYTIEEVRTA